MTVGRIHHVGITVADADRSLRFYCDLLGMKVLGDNRLTQASVATLLGAEAIDVRLVNLDTNDGRIVELLEYREPRGMHVDYASRDSGTAHVAFEVADLEAIRAGIEAAGGSVISRDAVTATDSEGIFKGVRLLYVRDPDGMILELVQRPEP